MTQGARPASASLPHMPQLDGLRALAVLAVMIRHGDLDLPIPVADLALMGVELFFVLSGFLITSILLRGRASAERDGTGMGAAARHFYVRRIARIFPLYYLVIAIGLVLNLSPAREAWPWLATYTFNVYLAKLGWFTEYYPHLWTLAIEEQFYIVWPWLVLLLPRRWLPAAVIAAILVAPAFRFYILAHAWTGMATYVLTPQYLDMLGIGALLAVLIDRGLSCVRVGRALLACGAALLAVVAFLPVTLPGRAAFALGDFPVALTFCGAVAMAAAGRTGVAHYLLAWRPLRYVGEISYGVYVYHLFIPALCVWTLARAHLSYPSSHAVAFVLTSSVTLLIASASWRWFERPIRDLGHLSRSRTGAEGAAELGVGS